MKALVYVAPEKMEIQDVPKPVPREGEVLLKISATGICGSDIHGFLGHSERRKPGLILGHEAVGVVQDCGGRDAPTTTTGRDARTTRVVVNPLMSCGMCAACLGGRQNLCANWRLLGLDRIHGTYAEFVAVPAAQLYAVSPELSENEAVFTEPLANLVHLYRVCMHEIPETLAIFGAGPIGALALALAKLRGISRVCVIDRNEKRLAAAKQLKADCVINSGNEDPAAAIKRWAGGGVDFVIDAAGFDATRRASVACCARGGRIVFIGMGDNESALPWIEMIRNEQAVFTTFCYTPRDFVTSLRLLESRQLDLTPWTETRTLDDGQSCFMKMAHDPGATLKLIFKF